MRYDNLVIVSGGFDPIHKGHIEYFRMAKNLYSAKNKVICILNSDKFLIDKKGFVFQHLSERFEILSSVKYIDEVFCSIDKDSSVNNSIRNIVSNVDKKKYRNIIFAKGGDRRVENIPEVATCNELKVKIVDGLGKKIQSSSKLVKGEWKC